MVPPYNFFSNHHHFFSKDFPLCYFISQLIPSILASSCYYQWSRAISSTKGFFQAIYVSFRQIIGHDGSITVVVFDYVHWKLHVASFFLKSVFSFLKRRDLSDPERFSSPSAHMLFTSISHQVTASHPPLRSWTQIHLIRDWFRLLHFNSMFSGFLLQGSIRRYGKSYPTMVLIVYE